MDDTGIKAFWQLEQNVGDTLTPVLLADLLGVRGVWVPKDTEGKFLGVGSVLGALRENDIVWGTGLISDKPIKKPKQFRVLALRGPMTRDLLGVECDTFGDPALLLPKLYQPEVCKKFSIGVVPHYVDFAEAEKRYPGARIISVRDGWREFVKNVLECNVIISTSLHGIVIAEAYGIPAVWEVWSDKIIGGEFKFQDYFLGTGRDRQEPGKPLPPIKYLKSIQRDLLCKLKKL